MPSLLLRLPHRSWLAAPTGVEEQQASAEGWWRDTRHEEQTMSDASRERLRTPRSVLYKLHPWHGVSIGAQAPTVVTAYIVIVPTDTVKYELDKTTGYLKIDRPQQFSSVCPTLYGLIPQTLCADRVGALCAERTGRADIVGDGDPLDICVLTEKTMPRGDVWLHAIPIGGLRTIDRNAADDKIIAVLQHDARYGRWQDIQECPPALLDRLTHYFLTYKDIPYTMERRSEVLQVYGREEAHEVIRRSQDDYHTQFGDLGQQITALRLDDVV
jgi:inorganic pyrophosphatase